MDAVAVILGLIAFLVLIAMVEGIDRI